VLFRSLKVGGTARYEKLFTKLDGASAEYSHNSLVRVEFEARNDSEWGTVYSWVRFEGEAADNAATDVGFYYYFGIGGLEFGNYDNPWTRFMGDGGRTDFAGEYGSQSAQYISYTADFGAYKAWISLDNDANQGGTDAHKYMPDVSGALSGTFGSYEGHLGLGYDESEDSLAAKAILRGDLDMFGFTAIALYSDDIDNRYFSYEGFSAIIGLSAKVTDQITLAKDFQYWDNGDWQLTGDIAWEVASGFNVLLEGSYGDFDGNGSMNGYAGKVKTGMLRFERTF
jgi:hypothetical protein